VECAGKSEKVKIVSAEQLSVHCPAIKSKKGGKGVICVFSKEKSEEQTLNVKE
jgi:hypothetical protein